MCRVFSGKINSISETGGIVADAERLERISKQINAQVRHSSFAVPSAIAIVRYLGVLCTIYAEIL